MLSLPLSLSHPLAADAAGEHPSAPSPRPSKLASPDLSGLRVLVVDDDRASCELAHSILSSMGAEVLLAASAEDGFRLLTRHRPDVLLADLEMPGEDGYSLIRRVRALTPAEGGDTAAAAVTAMARKDDRWRVLGAGFHLHLEKPIDPLGLAIAVANLAGRRSPAATS